MPAPTTTRSTLMIKAGIDQDALITMFAEAGAKQGEALRKAVSEATLRALQGRELTLDNIKKVVKNVAEAASTGIARNPAPAVDVESLLGKALGGIDSALLQAVEANRKALEQFVSGGVSLTEKPLKEALANIEKMEGSATGMQATQTVEQLMGQAQTMLRDGRASGMRAAQAMLDNYAALASGVLIGMSEGLQAGTRRSGGSGGGGGSATAAAAAP